MAGRRPWVLLSKPVREPVRDGTTALVRTLVRALPRSRPVIYFGDPHAPLRAGDHVLAAPALGYQPRRRDKARLLGRLLDPRLARHPLHAFFAANRASAMVLAGLRRIRSRPVMLTLPASTGAEAVAPLLRGLDRVVVTSAWGRQQLLAAGLPLARVACIPPGVELPPPGPARPLPLPRRTTVLFAGDLDPTVVDRLVMLAARLGQTGRRLVVASRPKGPEHAAARDRLARALRAELRAGRVELHGELYDLGARFDQAALQVYLASHARRKVDLPLVLLEGLARGVPAAVLDAPPVSELVAIAARVGHEAVVALDGRDLGRSLDALVDRLESPARLVALGDQARPLVQDAFDARAMAQAYLREYEALE